ncbi:hypothetical protein BTVI_54201 [Pitangus sulphuratus]|nr:hypothetical protein BTVI_54201 [Pitangus sulphuratus]
MAGRLRAVPERSVLPHAELTVMFVLLSAFEPIVHWSEDNDNCQLFQCLQLGVQAVFQGVKRHHHCQPQEATISEGKAAHLALGPVLLVLPSPCSFFPGRCLSVPLARPVLLFSNSRSLWAEWPERGDVQAQLEAGLGDPPREQLSLFAVSLCSTIFCHLCLAQAGLKSYIAYRMVLLEFVGGSGSDNKGYRIYRCAQKEGEQRMEKE